MPHFDHDHHAARAHREFHSHEHHHPKLTHEILAGAAAYEAAKLYEEHCAKNGKPVSHAKAKELFAAFAGVAIDRMVETRGLDAFDKHKAKRDAEAHAQEMLAQGYN